MLRRALAGAALLVLLATWTAPATSESIPPTSATAASATTPVLAATTPLAPSPQAVLQPPPRWTFTEVRPPLRPDPPTPTVEDAKAWALETLGPREFYCLDRIVWHESRWNPLVWNHKGSGAYGLVQAKPGSKMASAGADWQTNPITQLRWAIAYAAKYGSLCGAWAFWVGHGWW